MMISVFRIWKESKGIGKLSYNFRMMAYLSGLTIVIAYHLENQIPFSIADYLTAILAFVVPHLILYRFVESGKNMKVIVAALNVDFLFVGWVIGILDVCLVPSIAFSLGALSNHISSNGFKKIYSLLMLPAGFALVYIVDDVQFIFSSSVLINYLTAGYMIIHAITNSYVLHVAIQRVRNQNLEIKKQRLEIQEQSEELRVLNESLMDMNANLEQKVTQRTKEIESKNKKLAEYSFTNAHELRAPVARILGLIHLLDYANMAEGQKIIERLKVSAEELDSATRTIGARLEAEDDKPLLQEKSK